MRIVDAHCHYYAYREEEYRKFGNITIAAVSEDYKSSVKTCALSKRLSNIAPFIGIHPWNINDSINEELIQIISLINNEKVAGIGEVGLDFRFSNAPKELQTKLFEEFCKIASEKKLPLNVHAYSAWREALAIAVKNEVRAVLFHWYTGPEDLLKEIKDHGYFISINPTVTIQPRQRRIIEKASDESILTESDGPYVYRSIRLDPSMIRNTLGIISQIRKLSIDEVSQLISNNYERYISSQ